MLRQAQIYLRHSEGDATPTIPQLKATLQVRGGRALILMQRMYRYEANITGFNPYWFARTQELQAVFATKGCATLFFTLSTADNHWPDLHRLMPPGYEDSPAGRRRAVIDNPHTVDSFFGAKVDTSALFDGVLKVKWKSYRHEYQGRGSIHTHGCVKLDNDPGLVELTAVNRRLCEVRIDYLIEDG